MEFKVFKYPLNQIYIHIYIYESKHKLINLLTGSESENSAASTNESNTSNGITAEGVSSFETSPSTRQYNAVTQSTIIKRKGVLKPDSADVEVSLYFRL